MDNKFFTKNRENFIDKIADNTIAVFTSGECVVSTNDENYRFEVDRNFYYITGIDFPGVKIVIEKINGENKVSLFVPYKDPQKEKWTGIIPDKAKFSDCCGISENDIFYTEEFEEYLYELSSKPIDSLYLLYQEVSDYAADTSANILYYKLCDIFQSAEIIDALGIFTDLRKIKSQEEIQLIRESAKITDKALRFMLGEMKAGVYELELSAAFEYIVKRNKCKLAFDTIVASGENATILHYIDGQKKICENELVLVDCGASLGWYNSDVTRTYPVSGTFTDEQKLIYQIVLDVNKLIISAIKPGESLVSLNEKVKEFYAKRLKEIGLIKEDSEVEKYYYHSVSHSLGLDTHDLFDRMDKLKPGMVITVEPGLYIKEKSIGIRIEDDVLVTEEGYIVLTDFIPKEISEIESFMSQI